MDSHAAGFMSTSSPPLTARKGRTLTEGVGGAFLDLWERCASAKPVLHEQAV